MVQGMSHDEAATFVRTPRFTVGDRVQVVKLTPGTAHLSYLLQQRGNVVEYHGIIEEWPWYRLQVGTANGSLPEWCLVPEIPENP